MYTAQHRAINNPDIRRRLHTQGAQTIFRHRKSEKRSDETGDGMEQGIFFALSIALLVSYAYGLSSHQSVSHGSA